MQRIKAIIQQGKQLGRTINMPTINITVKDNINTGLYATYLHLDNKYYNALSNVSTDKKIGKKIIETHAYNKKLSDNLYGRKVEIIFLKN